MQFTLTTDYAIRAVLSLEVKGKVKHAAEIAEEMKIPQSYLNKVLKKLRVNGLLGSVVGSNGGHYLLKGLDEITLRDVASIMEPTLKCNRCLEVDKYCSRQAADYCKVRQYFLALQDEVENRWLSVTLMSILQREGEGVEKEPCKIETGIKKEEKVVPFQQLINCRK